MRKSSVVLLAILAGTLRFSALVCLMGPLGRYLKSAGYDSTSITLVLTSYWLVVGIVGLFGGRIIDHFDASREVHKVTLWMLGISFLCVQGYQIQNVTFLIGIQVVHAVSSTLASTGIEVKLREQLPKLGCSKEKTLPAQRRTKFLVFGRKLLRFPVLLWKKIQQEGMRAVLKLISEYFRCSLLSKADRHKLGMAFNATAVLIVSTVGQDLAFRSVRAGEITLWIAGCGVLYLLAGCVVLMLPRQRKVSLKKPMSLFTRLSKQYSKAKQWCRAFIVLDKRKEVSRGLSNLKLSVEALRSDRARMTRFVVCTSTIGACMVGVAHHTYLPLYTSYLGIAWVFLVRGVGESISEWICSFFSYEKERAIMGVGLCLVIVGVILLWWQTTPAFLYSSSLLMGIGLGAHGSQVSHEIYRAAPEGQKGRAVALGSLGRRLSGGLGVAWGLIIPWTGMRHFWLVSLVLLIPSFVALLWLRRNK